METLLQAVAVREQHQQLAVQDFLVAVVAAVVASQEALVEHIIGVFLAVQVEQQQLWLVVQAQRAVVD
jgi:hypothetical protein